MQVFGSIYVGVLWLYVDELWLFIGEKEVFFLGRKPSKKMRSARGVSGR